ASVQSRVPRSCHGAVLRPAAEQQDDMVEVILRFHVGEDRRKSVLLEDRRGTQRPFEAMDLVRADYAAKGVEGFPMLFTIVRQRLEPPLHLFRRIDGVDDRSFSRGERRPGRCGTRAMFEAFAALLDFVLVPIPVRCSVVHVRSLAANRSSDRMITPSVVSTKTIPQVNISGRIRIVQIGTADDTPTPTLIAIRAISVAVSKPRPNRTPTGKMCHGFRMSPKSGRNRRFRTPRLFRSSSSSAALSC